MIKPVLLWSDVLVFVLVIAVGCFLLSISKHELNRQKWSKVFQSRTAVAAFVVICIYVLIALLDSLHFRTALPAIQDQSRTHYSNEVRSVLDLLLAGIKANDEKTYSQPFAIYSFAKENMTDASGSSYRDFPRLKKAGSHLSGTQERVADIAMLSLKALLLGSIVAGVLCALLYFAKRAISRKTKASRQIKPIPWWVAYLTLAAFIVAATWVLMLGNFYHILGTDKVGEDVLYQSIKAIRTGVLIGTLSTLLTLPLAVGFGICAGYFRGWVDDVVQYIYTTLSSIPGILLIAASVLLIDVYIETHQEQFQLTIERADFKFLALCMILGLTSWTGLCRLLRAETLKVSQLEYIQAAHAFGVAHHRIIRKHILPNVTHIILISLVLDFSVFVLAEAVLSYIGVGVDPSMESWGNMINAARSELSRDPTVWWSVLAAFVLMFTIVLAANLFSDRVRDAFDPKHV